VILVMDRENEDLQLIASLLKKSGFSVHQCLRKADVVNLCRTSHYGVQLVIIDTSTRGITFSELLDEIQAVDPGIRVLLISDQNEPEPVQDWPLRSNVRGHLSRPFRRAQFLGSVLEAAREPLVRTA